MSFFVLMGKDTNDCRLAHEETLYNIRNSNTVAVPISEFIEILSISGNLCQYQVAMSIERLLWFDSCDCMYL